MDRCNTNLPIDSKVLIKKSLWCYSDMKTVLKIRLFHCSVKLSQLIYEPQACELLLLYAKESSYPHQLNIPVKYKQKLLDISARGHNLGKRPMQAIKNLL